MIDSRAKAEISNECGTSHACQNIRRCSKNYGDLSKGHKTSLKWLPVAKSGQFECHK